MGTSLERGRVLRGLRVGTHVVANRAIAYKDVDVAIDAGDKGVVVAPEFVQPIVRVVWDDHPGRSFTTNVGSLDPCDDCARPEACPQCDSGDVTKAYRLPAGTWKCQTCGAVWRRRGGPQRERDRAKASGEQVCRVCGCSDLDACPGGCAWVAPDLCSACEGDAQ